jgi:anti-sigma regulatory factor (Ser/Thr protein kinase)
VHRATFEPVPESAKAARDFVRGCLPGGAGGPGDVVALLASELATNAIVHARSNFVVWVEVGPHCVRVGVEDASPALPVIRPDGHADTGGRGLAIIDALADRWGAESTPKGKRTWFQISA